MKLLKYIKDYRFPAIGGFVSKIAEAALELLVPLVMADIIDVGIANNDQNYILSREVRTFTEKKRSGRWLRTARKCRNFWIPA